MFFAMNRISCQPDYVERFEEMFRTRAREVDKMAGFQWAKILRPVSDGKPYIIMTFWDSKADFDAWVGSEAYKLGHQRGFQDIAKAREEGRQPPISSDMELYEVFTE